MAPPIRFPEFRKFRKLKNMTRLMRVRPPLRILFRMIQEGKSE